MIHYDLSRQERTQIDGRWHDCTAPLCGTGDGHFKGTNPNAWRGTPPPVTCPRCIDRSHLVARRERDQVEWNEHSTVRISTFICGADED